MYLFRTDIKGYLVMKVASAFESSTKTITSLQDNNTFINTSGICCKQAGYTRCHHNNPAIESFGRILWDERDLNFHCGCTVLHTC